MSKLTANIGEADTRAIRGIAPVAADSTFSTLLPQLANAAVTVDKAMQTSSLQEELDDVSAGGAMAHAEASDIMQEDVAGKNAVESFHNEMSRLQRAVQAGSGTNEDAMLVRAQARLKTAIDKRPGYARELRAAYANSFGLDSGIRAEATAAQKARVNQLEAYKKDYQQKGLDLTKWGTPEGTKAYVQKSALDQKAAFAAQRRKLAEDNDALESLDQRGEVVKYASTAVNNVDTFLQQEFVLDLGEGVEKSILQLTDEDIAGLSGIQQRASIDVLEKKKRELQTTARSTFGKYKNISTTDIDKSVEPALNTIDTYIAILNKEVTAKQAASSLDYTKTVSEKDLWDDPNFATLAAVGKYGIPTSAKFDLQSSGIMANILKRRVTNVFGTSNPEDQLTQHNDTYNWLQDSQNSGATGERKEVGDTWMQEMVNSSVASYDWMNDKERLQLMKFAQNPNFVSVADKAGVPPEHVEQLKGKVTDYLVRTTGHLAAQLGQAPQSMSLFGIPIPRELDISKYITVELGNRGFRVTANDDSNASRSITRQYRDVYMTRLNEALKGLANLEGRSLEDVANIFLQQTEARVLLDAMVAPVEGEGSE